MRAAVCILLLAGVPCPAQAEPRPPAAIRADLETIEKQLATEAELIEALAAFPAITLEEFTALPTADLGRSRFAWAWAGHYRAARLGQETITSVPAEADATRRARLEAFDPTQLKSGMQTDGAARVTDAQLPPVLHACAEEHEALHERDLHAQAWRFARARTEALLADGTLRQDPGYVRAEAEDGQEAALDAFTDALVAHDLAANARLVSEQRAAGAAGAVRMIAGPLRDANVYYGHVDPRVPAAENFERVKRLAAYELRAYEVSTRCLQAAATRLREELPGAPAPG